VTGAGSADQVAAGSFGWLARLARPLWGRVLLAAAAGALATGCGVGLLAVSGFLLARASQHPDIADLSVAVVAVRALSVGRGVSRYGERLAAHDVAFRVLAKVRVAIWRKLASLLPGGLPRAHSGDLLARLIADVDATQDLFSRGVTPVVAAVAVGAGAIFACLALIGPAGLMLATGLLAGGLGVPLVCLAAARSTARRIAPVRGQLSAEVADLVAGAAELTAFGAQGTALSRASAASTELARLARRQATADGLGTGLPALVAGVTVWGVLFLGVMAMKDGSIGRVALAAGTLTALAAFEAVTGLPAAAMAVHQARVSADRISGVLAAPDPITDPGRPRAVPAGPVTVRLHQAQVRYEPGAPLALDGVSLELPPGRRVALVGPNGAGKSTVAAVLLRFVELAGGTATVTEHQAALAGGDRVAQLSDYRADDLRTLIGGLPQDPHLFAASIAENLRIARPAATAAELTAVAGQVGLGDWIASLPEGLDTQVGQYGRALSGGQRQRIALARALLADPAVLILDEPTAQLDPDTARSFLTDLLAATAGRAVLLITHDLAGLDPLDEVVLLDHGKIVKAALTP
jgi:ATP-binding cassette, subfamily C, bacterial CydC